jgi:hypothetical protein
MIAKFPLYSQYVEQAELVHSPIFMAVNNSGR